MDVFVECVVISYAGILPRELYLRIFLVGARRGVLDTSSPSLCEGDACKPSAARRGCTNHYCHSQFSPYTASKHDLALDPTLRAGTSCEISRIPCVLRTRPLRKAKGRESATTRLFCTGTNPTASRCLARDFYLACRIEWKRLKDVRKTDYRGRTSIEPRFHTMKVLFLEDAMPTARAGDIRDVKNGFARNYLIPRGMAVLATEHELRRAEKLRAEAEGRRLRELNEWRDIANELAENPVDLTVRTGPTGRLYGSVTSAMIAARLSELIGRQIERKRVRMQEQIRMIGSYRMPVRFMDEFDAMITLNIVSDDLVEGVEEEESTTDPYAITDEILANGEIDMHGWEAPQAVDALGLIAGRILARNISQFRIIHGKGEGTLRQEVRDRLNAMKIEGTVIIWGPGRTDGDTDADSLEAVSWFTVS